MAVADVLGDWEGQRRLGSDYRATHQAGRKAAVLILILILI
ncbi:hypothetical protein CF161_28324 [Pseudomonas sp. CF161]|nr:hypothetical protein CF161_28324 [Pseudomonas sp. CF161]